MVFMRTTLTVRMGGHRQDALTRSSNRPGLHGHLMTTPIDLSVNATDPLAKLVAAVENHLGPGAWIDLAEPFIVEAYCMFCATWSPSRRPSGLRRAPSLQGVRRIVGSGRNARGGTHAAEAAPR